MHMSNLQEKQINMYTMVMNQFVKNGTAKFGQTSPTEISEPPPEVILNIPVRRNCRNEPFH